MFLLSCTPKRYNKKLRGSSGKNDMVAHFYPSQNSPKGGRRLLSSVRLAQSGFKKHASLVTSGHFALYASLSFPCPTWPGP